MATVTKDFRIKSGLVVEGTSATVNGYDVLTKSTADQNYVIGLIGGSATSNATANTVVLRDENASFAANNVTATSVTTASINSESAFLTVDASTLIDGGLTVQKSGSTGLDVSSSDVNLYLPVSVHDSINIANVVTIDANGISVDGAMDFSDITAGNVDASGTVTALTFVGDLTGNVTGTVSDISNHTTTNLTEGTNLYFTTARAQDSLFGGSGIKYDNSGAGTNAGQIAIDRTTVDVWYDTAGSAANALTDANDYTDSAIAGVTTVIGDLNTDDITELPGATNVYYTDARARAAVSAEANGPLTYVENTGEFDLSVGANLTVSNGELTLSNGIDVLNVQATAVNVPGIFYVGSNNIASFSQNLSMGTKRITNLADPTNAQDAATKAYVDGVAQGLDVKESVRVATTGNIDFFNEGDLSVIDGVTLTAGDRILVKSQTTASENGIYVLSSGTPKMLSRATDANEPAELNAGTFVFVEEGTVNGDTGWVVSSNNPITIGTSPMVWTQFSGAGTYLAGNGLTLTGNEFSVDATAIASQDDLSNAVADLTAYVDGFLNSNDGTTVQYIDDQDQATLIAANGYTDDLVAAGDPTATPTYLALDISSIAKQVAVEYTLVSSGVQDKIYSFPKADYRSAKFLVRSASGTHTEISEILLTLDTSDNVAITEYAVVGTNGSLAELTATVENGYWVSLQGTPTNANTVVTVYGTLLA